jgi:hypothetical protein
MLAAPGQGQPLHFGDRQLDDLGVICHYLRHRRPT